VTFDTNRCIKTLLPQPLRPRTGIRHDGMEKMKSIGGGGGRDN